MSNNLNPDQFPAPRKTYAERVAEQKVKHAKAGPSPLGKSMVDKLRQSGAFKFKDEE